MKYKIAFICNSNSKRSQMAEAIAKAKYGDLFDVYSAGVSKKDSINEFAIQVVKEKLGIDISKTQTIKTIDSLPKDLDIIVEMGCEMNCPFIYSEKKNVKKINFNIPTTKSYEEVVEIYGDIEKKIKNIYDIIFSNRVMKW